MEDTTSNDPSKSMTRSPSPGAYSFPSSPSPHSPPPSDIDSLKRKRTPDSEHNPAEINNDEQDDPGELRRSSRTAATQANTALQAIDTDTDNDVDKPDKQPKKKQKNGTCTRGALVRAVEKNDCGGLANPKMEIYAIYAKMASVKNLGLPAVFGTLLDLVRSNTVKLPSHIDGQCEDLALLASRVVHLKSANTATKFLTAVSCIRLAWKFDRYVHSDMTLSSRDLIRFTQLSSNWW